MSPESSSSTPSNPTTNPIGSKAGLGLQNASPALSLWICQQARVLGLGLDCRGLTAERGASSTEARTRPTIS